MFWFLAKFALIGIITITSSIGASAVISNVLISPTPTPTQFPTPLPTVSDPYITCGPGQYSKQTAWIRQSVCKNYTDCQLNDGSYKLMSKAECDEIQKKSVVNVVQNIDCVGPDGKHFQTTQQECDSFNAAWKNNKPTNSNTVTVGKPSSGCTLITINCNIPGHAYTGTGCNLAEAQASCDRASSSFGSYDTCKNEKQSAYDSCLTPCNSDYQYAKAACEYAFTGANAGIEQNPTKYGECLDEASQHKNTCSDNCYNSYSTGLNSCQ